MPRFRSAAKALSITLCLVMPTVALPSSAAAQTSPFRATSTVADVQVIAEGADQTVFALVVAPKVGSFSTVNT